MICIDGDDLKASPGGKLIGDATDPCKEVKYFQFIKIIMVLQDIEKAFLSIVSCWPDLQLARGQDPSSLVCPSYDPQLYWFIRLKY